MRLALTPETLTSGRLLGPIAVAAFKSLAATSVSRRGGSLFRGAMKLMSTFHLRCTSTRTAGDKKRNEKQ